MRRYLFLVLLAASTVRGDAFMDAYTFYDLSQHSGNMVQGPSGPNLNGQISLARKAYWRCGDCPEKETLLQEYLDLLSVKDSYYMMGDLIGYTAWGGLDPGTVGGLRHT